MYTDPHKKFATKKVDQILKAIKKLAHLYPEVRRIFLADGDAMVLSTRRLLEILSAITDNFPEVSRVSTYCLPSNVKNKSVSELSELNSAGLKLVYIGAESGDDEVLHRVQKGETFATTVSAINKISEANIKSSVMLLNGLGGNLYSEQHALNSAKLANETQPNYLATLVVSFPKGKTRFLQHFPPEFRLLDQQSLFCEMEMFLSHCELKNSIFRSDHASNYLVLKGVLGKDKEKLINQLRTAQSQPENIQLREEWQRGL